MTKMAEYDLELNSSHVKWSEVTQSYPTLCNPMDCSLPGSIHGIFQARILEWVAISYSRGSSWPGDRTQVSRIVGKRFQFSSVQFSSVAQLCPTLCDHRDCSLPGSIHGIFQARIPECVAISFSRGSSRPRDRIQVSCIAGRRFTVSATKGL